MRAYPKMKWVGFSIVVIFLTSSLAMADGKRELKGAPPAAEPRFQAGDTLAVEAGRANLMLGDEVIAVLGRGRRIVVVEVRDSWIGTHVVVGGAKKAGWLRIMFSRVR